MHDDLSQCVATRACTHVCTCRRGRNQAWLNGVENRAIRCVYSEISAKIYAMRRAEWNRSIQRSFLAADRDAIVWQSWSDSLATVSQSVRWVNAPIMSERVTTRDESRRVKSKSSTRRCNFISLYYLFCFSFFLFAVHWNVFTLSPASPPVVSDDSRNDLRNISRIGEARF